MIEIDQDGQRIANNLVGFFAFDIDDEAHAARFVLELRVIESLLGRQAGAPFWDCLDLFFLVSAHFL